MKHFNIYIHDVYSVPCFGYRGSSNGAGVRRGGGGGRGEGGGGRGEGGGGRGEGGGGKEGGGEGGGLIYETQRRQY